MITLNILMIFYTVWVVSKGRAYGRREIGIATIMLGWLVALHLLLSNQLLLPAEISRLGFFFAVLLGLSVVGAGLLLIPFIKNIVWDLNQEQLLLMQGIRVFYGSAFLLQGAIGILPKGFAILDGIMHVSAGFFGLIASYSLAARLSGERRAWFANLFGLADILIVASTLAFVLLPEIGPFHSMMYAVFLPAPIWFWCHVISIWKLCRVGERKELKSNKN